MTETTKLSNLETPWWRALISTGGGCRSLAAIFLLTLLAQLGSYIGFRASGLALREATLAMLVLAAVWNAIACPVFAAGAHGSMGAILRSGLVADTTAIALLAVAVDWRASGEPGFSIIAIIKLYCTYAAVALFAVGAVRIASSDFARLAAAVAATFILLAAMASPLWVNGLIVRSQGEVRQDIAAAAVWLNPVYSLAAPMASATHYVVHQESVMYRFTLIGDYVGSPVVPWYASALVWLTAAVVLAGLRTAITKVRTLPVGD